MRSIRTKITVLTLCAAIIVLAVTTVLSVTSIKKLGTNNAHEILYLLCEEGQKNLNSYFKSVEQSVETVSGYASADLRHTSVSDMHEHMNRVEELFEKVANNTSGVLTYYYRIDPEVNTDEKGFWYVNLDGKGFKEHEVTDITLYDTDDQSALVWFTVPKAYGTSIWLPPYVTDNLDVYVLSYNVPVYQNEHFIGVIGIELDYSLMAEPVDSITLFENGYAFINDKDGVIIYSPHMDMDKAATESKQTVPAGLLSDSEFVKYTYEGVEKQAVRLPLNNGMWLNVTVPISEINAEWHELVRNILLIATAILIVLVVITMKLTKRITVPLKKLTEAAAEVDAGNYDVEIDYKGSDEEIAILTGTFSRLTGHLKKYIQNLNDLAYSDSLTSVRNKGAFTLYIDELSKQIGNPETAPEFAIGFFDCNDLKQVNDQYGHEHGDTYLKRAVSLICNVFDHSAVFRIGGDEFAAIIKNEDFRDLDNLRRIFISKMNEISAAASEPWEKVNVAMGIAIYNPKTGESVDDVIRRADTLMYEHKSQQKTAK